ncbi:MAG: VgrG-related protein [Anaerolineae bacterium]|nr:VgrG-related protein [Anaerolineae bacterium]
MPEYPIITVNGTALDDQKIGDMIEAVVDTNLYLPAMFALTFDDELDQNTGKLKYTDTDTFKVGVEVKIEIETDEIQDEYSAVKATLIIGEITAIEPFFSADGRPYVRICGYDRSHRLTRGKKTRTYGDANPNGQGISDEQIINTIVQETSQITGKKIDTSGFSSVKYAYMMQYNQSDLEFLWSRARALGYQVYVEDKTLYFQKADAHRGDASAKPGVMRWRDNLTRFEPRLTLLGQVDDAVVKGWDPHAKQALEGKVTSDTSRTIPQVGLNKKGSAMAKEAFGTGAEEIMVNQPVLTVDQAKVMAGAHFARAESTFIQADGECRIGDPRLIAGRLLTVEDVGERFSGDYYVTEARHSYRQGEYSVTFSVTGRNPNTLSYLLIGNDGRDPERIYGVVTAKVTSLEDPEELGRVQLMYPWLPKYKDADLASNWARIAAPMAGMERGTLFIPEVDDEVLVAFEHGDVNYPYIVGALWNNTDKLVKGEGNILSDDKKKVDQRIIRSRSGHLILLDDKEGEERLIIKSMSGHTLTLTDKSGSEQITLVDKTGKNKFTVDSAANTLTIEMQGDVTVTPKGKLTFDSTGDVTIQSKANINLKTSSGDIKIDGLNVQATAQVGAKITGNAQASVESSGQTTVKGSIVMIN